MPVKTVIRQLPQPSADLSFEKFNFLRTSHLPMKVPKTFDNFDFNRITGKNVDRLHSLSTLSALYAHKNLAFIGRLGTGKTHLSQAFGRTCCEHGFKSYFIKMTELRDRMTSARRTGRESNLLAYLVRPSCLIIDEVGHCEFDKENTRLFFDMVDRRYQKEGFSNMVFTSKRDPAQWDENFCENDALLCALDRIYDDAVVFTIKGKASGEGSWRRLHCVLLPAHRLTHNRPGKQYCRGLATPDWRFSSDHNWLFSPGPK